MADTSPQSPGQRAPSPGKTVPGQRIVAAMGMQRCPACDAQAPLGVQVCPECGVRLRPQAERIRCRHCGRTSASVLTICPYCGRALEPGPSRLLTWGLPGLVVFLFLAVIVTRVAGGLGSDFGPPVLENIAITPVRNPDMPATGNDELIVLQPPPTATPALAETGGEAVVPPEDTPPAPPADTPTGQTAAAAAVTVPATATPTLSPTESPTPTATATATATPTPTATATPSSTPTPTPRVSPTSTPTPLPMGTYTVKPGDTIVGIATRYGLSVESILAANNLTQAEAARIQPGRVLLLPGIPNPERGGAQTYTVREGDTLIGIAIRFNVTVAALRQVNGLTEAEAANLRPGQVLIIPAPGTLATAAGPTATPTPAIRRYTVQAGDTIVGIATRFGVTTRQLMAANGLSEEDARFIRPGQELIIPGPGQIFPTPTPTQPPADGQPTPRAELPTYRLDPPQLLAPEPGVNVECRGEHRMIWSPVPDMATGDEYVLHLGYVNGSPTALGDTPVTWVLELGTGQRTDWRMDTELCNLAPQEYGRRWRWYVQVVDQAGTPVSPPSELREFTWR